MSSELAEGESARPVEGLSTDELLAAMARLGQVRLFLFMGGWVASINMNTNTTGASFEVSSEHHLPTPRDALKQCYERALGAVAQLQPGELKP